jgi:hypothetical protein
MRPTTKQEGRPDARNAIQELVRDLLEVVHLVYKAEIGQGLCKDTIVKILDVSG